MKKYFCVLTTALLGMCCGYIQAAEATFTLDTYGDKENSCCDCCYDCTRGWEHDDCDTFPREWLKRIDLELFFPEHGKTSGWIDSIHPLFGTDKCCEQTLFIQTRSSFETADSRFCRFDDNEAFSVGLGYRQLLHYKGCWQVGVNHFWDWSDGHNRFSIGAEAIGEIVTFRANYYDTVSGKKTVRVSPTRTEFSNSLDGWDVGAESQVPYMPWLHAIVRYYKWQGNRTDDSSGWAATLRGELTANSYFEAGNVSNQDSNAFALKLGFRLGRPQRVTNTLCEGWYSCCRWTPQNVCCLQLEKVRRTHFFARECIGENDAVVAVIPETPPPNGDQDYFDD